MAGRMHRTLDRPANPRPPISHETYLFLRAEVDRLTREVSRLAVDRDHWYMAANYTPEEITEMRHRASKGLDENGAWLWPDNLRTTR